MYEVLDGWNEPLDDCRSVDELPAAARGYVEFVERELDVEVTLVGTGAERTVGAHAGVTPRRRTRTLLSSKGPAGLPS